MAEPFPPLTDTPNREAAFNLSLEQTPTERPQARARDVSNGDTLTRESTLAGRLRSASNRFQSSSIPRGMWDATGSLVGSAPSLVDIRRGSYDTDGWTLKGQLEDQARRASIARRSSQATNASAPISEHPDLTTSLSHVKEHPAQGATAHNVASLDGSEKSKEKSKESSNKRNYRTEPYDNGYQFPPKHTWTQSTVIGLQAFWKWFLTPMGFLITVYFLNIVAWGGMLFLLLCNAAPAMCRPDCDDIESPRRKWLEVDMQILNALFCVTGFGLIPWRFRDLYYLVKYRLGNDELSLRRLAGVHRGWFRLAGSEALPVTVGPETIISEDHNLTLSAIPYPEEKIPDPPLTGVRATPTAVWKLDFVIWNYVWNTIFQFLLAGFMWGYNRYDRPTWATSLFVAIGCIVAGVGGIMVMLEGKRVKSYEGVPVSAKDQERLRRDRELGIVHYNNLKDEPPKEAQPKKKLWRREIDREGVVKTEKGETSKI